MNVKFFTLLKSDEERIAKKQRELDAEQAEFQRRQNLVVRRDLFLNRIDEAKAELSRQCKHLDEISVYTAEMFARDIITGFKVENLAVQFIAMDNLKSQLPKIKAELEKLIVAPVKQTLADFERENRATLTKLPPPVKMVEPKFSPVVLGENHFVSGASADLVAKHQY